MQIRIEVDEKKVLEYLQGAYDERITMETLMAHVLSDRNLVMDLDRFGVGDTEVMGRCVNTLSKALTGLAWPTYGDSQETKDAHGSKWDTAMGGRPWEVGHGRSANRIC